MSKYDFGGIPSKPNEKCRSCTDFKSWTKQQRDIFNFGGGSSTTEDKSSTDDKPPRDDCPWDKNELGTATWGLLHTMAAHYPDNPTDTNKSEVTTFISSLSKIYPCEYCAKDFRTDLNQNPVDASSQQGLSMWLCNFHNRVNKKLGKTKFDCSKVNERWRDGWLDGSCD